MIDFPKPVRQQELKQFLGLVNYFRSHIRDHSSISAPMNMLVHDYHRTHKVIWNPEATAAFEEMRKRIDNCPTLFFLDPKAPIFLRSDASIYGLGAYLFQLVTIDGKTVE